MAEAEKEERRRGQESASNFSNTGPIKVVGMSIEIFVGIIVAGLVVVLIIIGIVYKLACSG